jgi:2-methylcitrate dehydratase PrpD
MGPESTSEGASARLAGFVHDARFDGLPHAARHAARRALVNIVGCCLSGASHEIVETAARALLPLGGARTTSLLGRIERTDMLTAALLNCMSSAAYSFDDTHAQTILHPSGAVATTLLALAEQQPMSGEDFLLAFVLGVDIASRVSKAVSVTPASADMGWSQTGIAAGIGAAAAAAKALGLDPQRINWSIAIAVLQASGLRVAHGTMSATLIIGHAAQTGLRAALLAQQGLSAPLAPLEGKYGFASLYATQAHLPYLTESLGTRFEVEALGYKPYPCGVVIHPALDAALAWHATHGRNGASIERIHLRVHPSAQALGFRRHPTSALEAKVSLYHWIAAALSLGRAGIAEGQPAVIDEPIVVRLREIIEVESDSALTPEAAVLSLNLKSGEQQTISIDHCKGSVSNPMSDEDLCEKFRGQAHLQLQPAQASRLLENCWQIEQLPNAAEIARLAQAN